MHKKFGALKAVCTAILPGRLHVVGCTASEFSHADTNHVVTAYGLNTLATVTMYLDRGAKVLPAAEAVSATCNCSFAALHVHPG